MMTIDAVGTLVRRLENDWPYGARMNKVFPGPHFGSAIAECASSDGGVWFIGCDRHGEVFTYADTLAEVQQDLSLKVTI